MLYAVAALGLITTVAVISSTALWQESPSKNVAGVDVAESTSGVPAEVKAMFEDWVVEFEKSYDSEDETAERLLNFHENYKKVQANNESGEKSYTLALNLFADMSFEEFKASRLNSVMPESLRQRTSPLHFKEYTEEEVLAFADSVDWSTTENPAGQIRVNKVQNQGSCGSCWAFSAVASFEGACTLTTGNLMKFSEQQLVDCDHNGDQGCQGGLMDNAFEWLETHVAETETVYPYVGRTESSCKHTTETGYKVSKFTDVTPASEDAMMAALQVGPVSVGIEADQFAFQLYHGGVFKGKCGVKLDHGVVVVGYGTDAEGGDYWKVRNSWGGSWGEHGYILMERGNTSVNKGKGQCGVLAQPSYPTCSAASETTF